MLVRRVSGAPPTSTVNAPVTQRAGPITVPDATPSATPALSPIVIGAIVNMLCAGAHVITTLGTNATLIGSSPKFGYGIGVGAGIGVRQTSGKARHIPPAEVFASMVDLLLIFSRCGFARRRSSRARAPRRPCSRRGSP